MSSISAVSPIPSAIVTTPVAPIRPIAPAPAQPRDSGTGSSTKPQSANPPGVGRLLDMKV